MIFKTKQTTSCDFFHYLSANKKPIKSLTIDGISLYVLLTLVICFTILPFPSLASELQVPSEFVSRLQPPGNQNNFLRPSALFIDNYNGEVFVGDPGNNRVLIFDSAGTYKFEFAGAENFSTPVDISVNSEGYIYIIGSTREGRRIMKFDFDGLFLKEFPLPQANNTNNANFSNLTIDANDNIYALDQSEMKIYKYNSSDSIIHTFDIIGEDDIIDSISIVVSSITVHEDKLYIPFSSNGKVKIFNLDGSYYRSFGRRGNLVGELNFPVQVQVSNNVIMVLDKHRYNVVCYSFDYKFIGEFGGKGSSPGWFYHPTLLEANNMNQVYVGQIFENKIQLCQIPQFIIEKADLHKSQQTQADQGENNVL